MSRSKWKGSLFNKILYSKLNSNNRYSLWNKKNWDRNIIVPASLLGKRIYIYDGKLFKRINIVEEKIGYKLGDFCHTRKHNLPKKKKQLKKK